MLLASWDGREHGLKLEKGGQTFFQFLRLRLSKITKSNYGLLSLRAFTWSLAFGVMWEFCLKGRILIRQVMILAQFWQDIWSRLQCFSTRWMLKRQLETLVIALIKALGHFRPTFKFIYMHVRKLYEQYTLAKRTNIEEFPKLDRYSTWILDSATPIFLANWSLSGAKGYRLIANAASSSRSWWLLYLMRSLLWVWSG